jgi:subtilisin family serine protease
MRGKHVASPAKHAAKSRLPRILAVAAATVTVAGVGLATVSATGIASAEESGTIRSYGGETALTDSYIVVLNDGENAVEANGVDDTADELAQEFDGDVEHRYSAAVRGFSVRMTERQARRLSRDSRVSYVQQNHVYRASATQANPPSYGLDRIDQRSLPLNNAYTATTTAANVTAYVIDTGIRTTHQDFGGRASSGIDTVDNDNDATDCNGHGTHVAATIAGTKFGVAKGAKVVGVRVLDCAGEGSDASVIAGIDWVTRNAVKPAVANMSLGGELNDALDRAIRSSISSGVTYSVAAGNENADACTSSPARVGEAITVGATDQKDARADFSNFGRCVDVFAPGFQIQSASNLSDIATATLSGTSMATPHVTGAAALFLSANPNATPLQVHNALVAKSTLGKVGNAGLLSPNRLLFTGTDAPKPTPPTPTPPPAPGTTCGAFTQGTNVAVPDRSTAASLIKVAGCAGKGARKSKVDIHVRHPFRGDLVVDLIAPDGTVYRIKRGNSRDNSPDIHGVSTVNLSSENRNGVWKLRVRDTFRSDTGYIDSWTITL